MNLTESNYGNMSISERIDASGKMNEFNDAVAERDMETVIMILNSLELKPDAISSVMNDLGFFR